MYHLSIDHFIVGSFLLITLLIGLLAGRGIKDIREYAIANKMYDTGVLTITFLATYLGGFMTISVQETILSYGLVAGLAPLGTTIMFLYAGAFIAPKMLRFQHSITLGDMMQELYGLHGGIITGIIGGVYTIALVGIQVVALGYMELLTKIKIIRIFFSMLSEKTIIWTSDDTRSGRSYLKN